MSCGKWLLLVHSHKKINVSSFFRRLKSSNNVEIYENMLFIQGIYTSQIVSDAYTMDVISIFHFERKARKLTILAKKNIGLVMVPSQSKQLLPTPPLSALFWRGTGNGTYEMAISWKLLRLQIWFERRSWVELPSWSSRIREWFLWAFPIKYCQYQTSKFYNFPKRKWWRI